MMSPGFWNAKAGKATPTEAGPRRKASDGPGAGVAGLVPKRDEFEFQRGAAAKAEGEQRDEGGKDRYHAHDGMAEARKSLGLLSGLEF